MSENGQVQKNLALVTLQESLNLFMKDFPRGIDSSDSCFFRRPRKKPGSVYVSANERPGFQDDVSLGSPYERKRAKRTRISNNLYFILNGFSHIPFCPRRLYEKTI